MCFESKIYFPINNTLKHVELYICRPKMKELIIASFIKPLALKNEEYVNYFSFF